MQGYQYYSHMHSLSISLSQTLRGSHLVSDHLAHGLLEKVVKTRMVAERLLDLRLLKLFSTRFLSR